MANSMKMEFSNLTETDKSSKLYKWMTTSRPENPSSNFLKDVYNEQSSYYDPLFCDKMGWYCWKEGAEVFNDQLERSGFKKDASIIDAGAGTGLVGTFHYLLIASQSYILGFVTLTLFY